MHFHHTALATLVTSFCLETVSCSAVCWQLRGRAPRRGNVIQKLKEMQKLGLVRLKLKREECSHWCHWERRGTSSSELRLGHCCPRAAAMVWTGVNPLPSPQLPSRAAAPLRTEFLTLTGWWHPHSSLTGNQQDLLTGELPALQWH